MYGDIVNGAKEVISSQIHYEDIKETAVNSVNVKRLLRNKERFLRNDRQRKRKRETIGSNN